MSTHDTMTLCRIIIDIAGTVAYVMGFRAFLEERGDGFPHYGSIGMMIGGIFLLLTASGVLAPWPE